MTGARDCAGVSQILARPALSKPIRGGDFPDRIHRSGFPQHGRYAFDADGTVLK
jgi:hypothetical protein